MTPVHTPRPAPRPLPELGNKARRRRARRRLAGLTERGAVNFPDFTNERTRAYLYRIAVAAIPLLVVAGVLSSEDAAIWLGVAAAVLGVSTAGLATANTTTKPPPE